MLSASEAAKAVGLTKQGLMKAIREGRLSASKDANGAYQIDPSELFRVYEPVKKEVPISEEVNTSSPQDESQVRSLQREIDLLREMLRDRDETIKDLRDRLTRESEQLEKVTAVLTAKEERNTVPFWRRLLG